MNAQVNVPRILEGMRKQGWGVAAACAHLGVNNKTLKNILDGKVPKRLDALYRVINGLKIPMEEVLISGRTLSKTRLYVLPGRREPSEVA